MKRKDLVTTPEKQTHSSLAEIIRKNNEKINAILKDVSVAKYMIDRTSIVAVTDEYGIIRYANHKFCEVSKYEFAEIWGQNHRILNSGYHPKSFFKKMWATIRKGSIWQGEIRNRAKDGSYYWVDTTIVPFLNEAGKPYQYVAIRNEITERKEMEEQLRKSEEKYRLITENSSDLIATIDKNGNFSYISPSFKTMLGYELIELDKTNLLGWVGEKDRDNLSFWIFNTLSRKESSPQLELQLRTKNGEYLLVEAKISPIVDTTKSINKLVLVMRDITERKRTEETIYRLAYRDALTELPNRRYFMDYLRNEVKKAKQTKSQLAVMFLDVDRFKNINDSLGHEMGDIVLAETAKRIKANIRANDLVARLGGDEFTILLTNIVNKNEVEAVAERILNSFQQPLKTTKTYHLLSCSIGVAHFPSDGSSADELLKRADIALYQVKEQGRNGYLFFNQEMEASSLEKILLENELRKAWQQKQFYLDYQPKINIITGELVGMEALVRWDHPELGKIPPLKFIPIAEEIGLIVPLGEWILKEGCRQAVAWQKQGYPSLKLSINLSVTQFYQPDLVEIIAGTVEETGIEPHCLELEVTESAFVNLEKAVMIMKEIRELGVQTSIDDFGTGYSSLSYIKELPIDTLKIDASFVQDVHQNKESQAIVRAILSIAQMLKLNVIAEGVESNEQMEVLSKDGCIHGQGFLFSRPLSTKDFESYLKMI